MVYWAFCHMTITSCRTSSASLVIVSSGVTADAGGVVLVLEPLLSSGWREDAIDSLIGSAIAVLTLCT